MAVFATTRREGVSVLQDSVENTVNKVNCLLVGRSWINSIYEINYLILTSFSKRKRNIQVTDSETIFIQPVIKYGLRNF